MTDSRERSLVVQAVYRCPCGDVQIRAVKPDANGTVSGTIEAFCYKGSRTRLCKLESIR